MLAATEQAIEGPFYRPGAPLVGARGDTLVRREGERGAVLIFSGDVRGTGGEPLRGALVDVWQASAEGLYSPGWVVTAEAAGVFDHRQPAFNLRGRFVVDHEAGFEVRTIVPGAYRDPPGFLSEESIRPAHLHAKVSHAGYVPLTTQIFFEDDPHLDSDPADVVRPGLVTRLERRADPADLAQRGLVRPYFACWFGFVLAREASGHGNGF